MTGRSLIAQLFPVFYKDVATPNLINTLKCLAIKPVNSYAYKNLILR